MRKSKRQQPISQNLIQSLEELVATHDRADLSRALSVVEHDLSWKILQAALMKEYMSLATYSLEHSSKSGKQIEAAYYAGCAQTVYDTANNLISKYKDLLENRTAVVENVRPTEE